jgi:hypothetical protein
MAVTNRGAVGVVPALRTHDLVDLLLHQLGQHTEPDPHAEREQALSRCHRRRFAHRAQDEVLEDAAPLAPCQLAAYIRSLGHPLAPSGRCPASSRILIHLPTIEKTLDPGFTLAYRQPVIDSRKLLESLEGRAIHTVTGRENRVLRLDDDQVLVWTTRSPAGQPVPIAWVQDALDRLERDSDIEVSVASLRYRSAFIGAVLLQLPGASVVRTTPPRIRIPRST